MAIENSRLQNLINKIQGKQPKKGEQVGKEQVNPSGINIFTGQVSQAGAMSASIFGTQGMQGVQRENVNPSKGARGVEKPSSDKSIFDMFNFRITT